MKDEGVSAVEREIVTETERWRNILKRILDVILFLAERGLAFRGDEEKLGSVHNGNFLGFIEVLAKFDPVLDDHLKRVRRSQEDDQKRMQAHYLSNRSQNSFIQTCAERVRDKILEERQKSIYFSVIVDATPDRSHKEQSTFILRYVHWDDTTSMWDIHERFLCFENCSAKTAADIANLILRTLEKYKIPIADCRGIKGH